MKPTARFPRALVVGAGTMGAQLACLLAGAGTRVRLLDVDAATARAGLDRVATLRPAALYLDAHRERIRAGGPDELESAVADADWVLEAIVERLEPKRELFARLDAALPPDGGPIVTSNTSGFSIAALAEGRSESFSRRFLGTHFFNPPRYARLLELIPLPESDPEVVGSVADFAARLLGKGTVVARDTPAFIANRLGVHGLLTALRVASELGLGVDEVDDLTGQLIGRPKSATFRTLDLVGIDVAVAVADHCHATLVDDPEREVFAVPAVMRGLVERGLLGEKSGAGFYRKEGSEILALDLESVEYRPRRRVTSAAVEMARNESDTMRRLGLLLAAEDAAGRFLRQALGASLRYAAAVGGQIADDAWSVDAAMRWGFGWPAGPFETIDALSAEGRALLGEVAAAAPERYYVEGHSWSFVQGKLALLPQRPGTLELGTIRDRSRAQGLPSNAAATVLELPDRLLGLELHAKLNIIGPETLDMLRRATVLAAERYDGLVIGTAANDFSAGANLALLLIEAEDGEWAELDRVVRRFQELMTGLRYAPVPVVAAPRGLTLGGGTEIVLGADRAQPLVETYIGLVETGLGLIPAGGGSTAMARRAAAAVPTGVNGDHFAFFSAIFTSVATARVATSAFEARELMVLTDCDQITASPERQWGDAARTLRTLLEGGYRPPAPSPIPVLGRRGIAAAEALSYNQLAARQISEHDRKVALELARVMSGGDVAEGTPVAEQHLLDLEREAFLRLLGERLTRDRIRHTLKTGKPLRN
ncbi:MAG TPA: 3-hydroxyacyl-CoA dehydrogenase NAD-binding domain-containing protein [Candidatus Limnocylindria bacterium]|nr:3-hydroxyacyl-CoA dehydrogenase NAD-binding domain-containing protein [Candidatus Limnocylindria bacterium]